MTIVVLLLQVLRLAVPYTLTSVGATFSERGGVVNLALEGLMLAGAFGAAWGQYATGSAAVGVVCAMLAGLVVALLFAVVTVTFRADQIVAGIAVNLLVMGATRVGLSLLFGSSMNSPRIGGFEGELLLMDPLFVATLVAVFGGQWMLFRTAWGLRLRACGECAETVDSAGIGVVPLRYSGVIVSGVLAALGGAFLVFQQHSFTDNLTAGRGFMALAAMIVGGWSPVGAAVASLLFAAAEAMGIWLQVAWLPTQLVQSLPYVVTLLVLAASRRSSRAPGDVGVPFEKTR